MPQQSWPAAFVADIGGPQVPTGDDAAIGSCPGGAAAAARETVAAGLLRQQHQQQQQQQQLQQLQQVHQQQQQMVDGATAAARATSAARASACVRGSSIAAGSGDIFGIFVGALVGQHDGSGLQYDMQQRQQVVGGATAAARASATWADARASVCMRGGSGAAETGDVFAGALLGQHDGSGLHCVDGAVDADDEQRVGLLPGTVQAVRRLVLELEIINPRRWILMGQ